MALVGLAKGSKQKQLAPKPLPPRHSGNSVRGGMGVAGGMMVRVGKIDAARRSKEIAHP